MLTSLTLSAVVTEVCTKFPERQLKCLNSYYCPQVISITAIQFMDRQGRSGWWEDLSVSNRNDGWKNKCFYCSLLWLWHQGLALWMPIHITFKKKFILPSSPQSRKNLLWANCMPFVFKYGMDSNVWAINSSMYTIILQPLISWYQMSAKNTFPPCPMSAPNHVIL